MEELANNLSLNTWSDWVNGLASSQVINDDVALAAGKVINSSQPPVDITASGKVEVLNLSSTKQLENDEAGGMVGVLNLGTVRGWDLVLGGELVKHLTLRWYMRILISSLVWLSNSISFNIIAHYSWIWA